MLKVRDITKGRKFLNCVSSTQGKLLLRREGKKGKVKDKEKVEKGGHVRKGNGTTGIG